VIGTTLYRRVTLLLPLSAMLLFGGAARFVQGVGAALLMPNSLAVLGQTFTGPAKGRAVGIWAAASGVTGAIGPVLGGWLIDLSSWRAIFMINLPIAASAIALTLGYVPTGHLPRAHPLDVSGAVLITFGLGALTWTLTAASGPHGWDTAAITMAIIAILLLVTFVLVENAKADRALVPPALFSSRGLVGLNVVTLLLYAALSALLVLVPYVLIEAQGYSGSRAGAALLPLPVIMTVLSPLLGAFAVAPLTTSVLSQVEASLTGVASGFNSTVAHTGGLFATSLLGWVFASHGTSLIRSFHIVMSVCALVCWGAALSAVALLRRLVS
jgi:MFS family permease